MATSIHHGGPGSFKTFSCVQRFAIPALQKGRVVVTNIRAFDSIQRVQEVFPDLEFEPTARIINIDTSVKIGRELMSKWFHWIPIGSLVLIDECQYIYPKKLKLDSLELFDLETFERDNFQVEKVYDENKIEVSRPLEFHQAIDMQRHYNWDLYLTSTNIKKINNEIRESTETSYYHKSTEGLLPWKKLTWREVLHDPDNSGRLASHAIGTAKNYKADPKIFKCYKSTATGSFIKEFTRDSILKDKRLQAYLLLIFICWAAFVYFAMVKFADSEPIKKTVSISEKSSQVSIVSSSNKINPNISKSVSGQSNNKPSYLDDLQIYLVSKKKIGSTFIIKYKDEWRRYTDIELLRRGYSVILKNNMAILRFASDTLDVYQPPIGACNASIYFSDSSFVYADCFGVKVNKIIQTANYIGDSLNQNYNPPSF